MGVVVDALLEVASPKKKKAAMSEIWSNTRPRLLFIVDVPNWAHDFKTRNLMSVLGSEYDIKLRYQSNVTEEDIHEANLILVYYWLQFEAMQSLASAFQRNRHKLLVGISSSYELDGNWRDRGLGILRDLAAGVFVNNLLLYRQYQPLLNIPIFYTPNGVDTNFYQPAACKDPSSLLRVGWAGSLTNREPGYRGYHDFIVPAVGAVERSELLTAAREDRWRGLEEMREFYRSLDVYLCASRSEGTPNPCLEAAACGVPLLSTCVGNMPELVHHGINGFFVERNVDDIASKLRLLRDDISLRTAMSKQILEDIQAWDWSLRAQAYRQMCQEMLMKERSRDRVSMTSVKPSADDSDRLGFRVVVLLPAYNEEDIIVPCLRYLIKQGLKVYLIDNWSTDSTTELASQFLGKGLLAIEKFPKEGPPQHYLWKNILLRIEELTEELDADWFLLQDVDEIRKSPWPGLSLKDAILKVDRDGFNCIDHTVATFYPVDNDFAPGTDFEAYFKYFRFSDRPPQFVEIKAWKHLGRRIALAESGGHEIQFDGRRAYPYTFLLKHYPVRSQTHGQSKIFRERQPRWLPQERAIGWHTHYDYIKEGHSFVRRPGELKLFNEADFNRRLMKNGPPIIDWAREHVQAMESEPDKALTLLNVELSKNDEAIQSLAAELIEKGQALDKVTTEQASKETELERLNAALNRSTAQLVERDEKIRALVEHVAERQSAVESLATELIERHEKVLTLVDLVAERQRAVDALNAELEGRKDREHRKIVSAVSWCISKLYENFKYAFVRPLYRLLARTRRPKRNLG